MPSFVLAHLFSGGPQPPCVESADVTANGRVDITDPIAALGYLFRGAPWPDPPFGACKPASGLGCESATACGDRCPDPATESIEFSIASRTSEFTGRVRITGTIRNRGGDFESAAGQQEMLLYEEPLGGVPRLVARAAFTDLGAGELASVTHERSWTCPRRPKANSRRPTGFRSPTIRTSVRTGTSAMTIVAWTTTTAREAVRK